MRLFEQQQLTGFVGGLFSLHFYRVGGLEASCERRGKREERREKRANGRQLDSLHFYRVPEGRDGAEKGRALGEMTEERKEQREERDNYNQDEKAAERNTSFPEWCRQASRLLGAESMA